MAFVMNRQTFWIAHNPVSEKGAQLTRLRLMAGNMLRAIQKYIN